MLICNKRLLDSYSKITNVIEYNICKITKVILDVAGVEIRGIFGQGNQNV